MDDSTTRAVARILSAWLVVLGEMVRTRILLPAWFVR